MIDKILGMFEGYARDQYIYYYIAVAGCVGIYLLWWVM